MSLGSFFKGTSVDQNSKFADKDKKIINSTSWPEIFNQKVDISKVNRDSIRPWIETRVNELMDVEDELIPDLVISYLEEQQEQGQSLCPKKITVHITGFLGENAKVFMEELWQILLEAQDSKFGIPNTIINQKREETSTLKELIKEKRIQLEKVKLKELEMRDESKGNPPDDSHSYSRRERDLDRHHRHSKRSHRHSHRHRRRYSSESSEERRHSRRSKRSHRSSHKHKRDRRRRRSYSKERRDSRDRDDRRDDRDRRDRKERNNSKDRKDTSRDRKDRNPSKEKKDDKEPQKEHTKE
ncbi:unnamed protein product [Moneuplotes crassus]|uniref:PWI domain-containing protein n=3 Tax=Euplotes crassus TaxID=5936 RepID=A0AAD1XQH0_EUPCR|nr:unnamed protein product [Moneuplotes crassus]